MAFFRTNQTNTKYEVFKNGELLFQSRFTQIFLNPGLISFAHDDRAESATITPSTQIELVGAEGLTRIKIELGACMYEIETGRQSTAELLFFEIQIAADHKRQDMASTSCSCNCARGQGQSGLSEAGAALLTLSIQQLSRILANYTENLLSAQLLREYYSWAPPPAPRDNYYDENVGVGVGNDPVQNGNHQEMNHENQNHHEVLDEVMRGNGENENLSAVSADEVNVTDIDDDVEEERRVSDDGRRSSSSSSNNLVSVSATATNHYWSNGDREDGLLPTPGPSPLKRPFSFLEDMTANLPKRSTNAEDGRQLYVGNLPPNTTEAQLRTTFAIFGPITKIHIVRSRHPLPHNNGPIFGFIQFEMEGSVLAALNSRDYITLNIGNGQRRKLRVERTKARTGGGAGTGAGAGANGMEEINDNGGAGAHGHGGGGGGSARKSRRYF